MGSIAEECRLQKYIEKNAKEYEYISTDVKKVCGISFIYVKQNKFVKKYLLFNIIPICAKISYKR